jgi:hypothetical protein
VAGESETKIKLFRFFIICRLQNDEQFYSIRDLYKLYNSNGDYASKYWINHWIRVFEYWGFLENDRGIPKKFRLKKGYVTSQ